ncbi:DNA-processing protein DprA [Pontibacter sp. CAU 1760]
MLIKSIKGLLFLTYLTKYNIKHIYEILDSSQTGDIEKTVEEYLVKQNSGNPVDSGTVKLSFKTAYSESKLAYEKLVYNNIKTLSIFDREYPQYLKEISDKPPIIYYKGILNKTDLAAIVGSRNVSNNAVSRTQKVVEILTEHHYGIISGLALGIDKFAHEATLAKNAYTIAVLPVSLEYVYPVSHYSLANEIISKGGCILSEMPPGINRGKKSFVERNRIISALSNVVVPIEMGTNSGTMHTINYAFRYKKDLFLVRPTDSDSSLPHYEGINYLIDKHQNKKDNNVHIITGHNSFKEALSKIARTSSVGVQSSLF